jgi:putative sterol carrier protein
MEQTDEGIKARDFVNRVLPAALEMMKGKAEKFDCVVGLHLLGEDGGKWTLRLKKGEVSVEEGITDYWDCALNIPAGDYLAMAAGTLSPYQAMAKGKIGVSGNLGLAAKLRFLFRV